MKTATIAAIAAVAALSLLASGPAWAGPTEQLFPGVPNQPE